jgi:nucleotide-binding universal stress UspA family protein
MLEFDEIVVPVDGSEGSSRAAVFASRLASTIGCPIKLLYVFPATSMSMVGFARMSADEIHRAQQSAARDILDKARAAIGATADVGEVVLLGDPAQEIIDYSAQRPKTLLVMGRRGLSPMKSLLVGSVSEKVARHSAGAVTLVN